MANKLEQIALKKQREAEEAREAEIKSLASVIATETISRIKNLSADEKKPLEATISELSKGLAEAVALSNEKLGGEVSVSFAKLVDNFKSALPEKFDNSTNEKLFAKIADDILKFDNAIKSLELNPTINLKGITATELKAEVDRLIEKLPKDAKDSVKIEYEKAGATNYINVRLTDGINFYKALGGGGGGGGVAPLVELTAPTAKYGYNGKSETASYQYLFFEDKNLNWYILRKNLTTNIVDYVKGDGGFMSVYDSPTTAPSPANGDYGSYGEIF
jgi:hypothetical protein